MSELESEKDIPIVKRPFVNVYDNNGELVNIILVEFLMDKKNYNFFLENKDNMIFLGISSYAEYPNLIQNPNDTYSNPNNDAWKYDYKNMFDGWLHCFRNPTEYIPDNVKKILISESDFSDEAIIKPDSEIEKEYDFIFVCAYKENTNHNVKWISFNKNAELAEKCINIMCSKYKLKGLLVGCDNIKINIKCDYLIDKISFVDWSTLIKYYKKSKFVLMPSIHDASPRVITEALASNISIIVNNNIIGGWKYVNSDTGVFFNDEKDFSNSLETLLQNLPNHKPREYYVKNFGIINSGKKLLNFVKENYSDKLKIPEDSKYIVPRFKKINYVQTAGGKQLTYFKKHKKTHKKRYSKIKKTLKRKKKKKNRRKKCKIYKSRKTLKRSKK